MCVNYNNLNKACPKDLYPSSNIDQLTDNAFGFRVLIFGDTFTKYNQLKMHSDNEDKMAFIINEGVYYYKVMSFRLKTRG